MGNIFSDCTLCEDELPDDLYSNSLYEYLGEVEYAEEEIELSQYLQKHSKKRN